MKKKPTKEEILEKYFPLLIADEDEWGIHVCKAMQEYANLYHKEKLREELIAYDEYLDEYVDHKRSELRVGTYLKTKG